MFSAETTPCNCIRISWSADSNYQIVISLLWLLLFWACSICQWSTEGYTSLTQNSRFHYIGAKKCKMNLITYHSIFSNTGDNIRTHRTEHAVGWKWGCHISAHSDCNHFDRSFLGGLLLVFNYWSSGGKDDGPLIPCLPDNLSPRQLTLFSLLDLGDKSTATLIIKDSGLASTNRCLCQVQVTFRSDSVRLWSAALLWWSRPQRGELGRGAEGKWRGS